MEHDELDTARGILEARAGEDDYDEELCAAIGSVLLQVENDRESKEILFFQNRVFGTTLQSVHSSMELMRQSLAA